MTASLLVYDVASGEILKHAVGVDRVRVGPGEAMISAEWPGPDHYVHDGEVRSRPPSPCAWALFDPSLGLWTDPRTAEEVSADEVAALAQARREAIAQVNRIAGEVRSKFVTVIPAQDMVYLRKEAEARRYLSDASPDLADYPYIAAEIGITGASAEQVAQVYVNLATMLDASASQLETARLGTIAAIEAATAPTAIEAALAAYQAALEAFG